MSKLMHIPLFLPPHPVQIHQHRFVHLQKRSHPQQPRRRYKTPKQPPRATAIPASSPTPKLTTSVAKSSIHSLFTYFRALSITQPFLPRRLTLSLICILSSKLVGITVPLLFQHAVDSLTLPERAFNTAATALILHCLARIFSSAVHELRNGVFSNAGQRIGRSFTGDSFRHIHGLEAAFHNSSRTGALTRVVDRGTRAVMTIFRALLFSFFPTLVDLCLVVCVLTTRFSTWYVAVTVFTFVAFIAWTLWINDHLGMVRSKMNAAENDASAKLTDSLINSEAVKAFSNEEFEYRRYDQALERFETVAVRNEWLYVALNFGQGAIYTLGLTAILLRAAKGVTRGALTVGNLVLLSTMLHQLWVPLNFLGWQYREVKQSLIDVQNLFDVLKRQPKIVDAPDAEPLVVTDGEITFDRVSFQYPEPEDDLLFTRKDVGAVVEGDAPVREVRRLALDKLSFSVPGGTALALVGSSGSGKSTATRLLYRLYDLTGGKIFIDGQDISKATLASLRQAVSIVPQDTSLFNDTIAYNIRYGRPTATDEEVIAAAKAASIHDVIMRTPQGYQTLVGERGVRLSGGERQRLSVARAFLKGSKIILEDESTSALDTLTEMEVSRALLKLGINRTRIIVAHRLSTIMNVDHIVVLQYGRKVEEGSFDDLVSRKDGVFRGMWERQQKREEGEDHGIELGHGDRFVVEEERRGREDDVFMGKIVENI